MEGAYQQFPEGPMLRNKISPFSMVNSLPDMGVNSGIYNCAAPHVAQLAYGVDVDVKEEKASATTSRRRMRHEIWCAWAQMRIKES